MLLNSDDVVTKVKEIAREGLDHIVEVAFAANIERDVELLKQGGTLATYATNERVKDLPFWPMVFKNIQVNFLGSDDFLPGSKVAAARDLNNALAAGWHGYEISNRMTLTEIAKAHEEVEHPMWPGRVIVLLD